MPRLQPEIVSAKRSGKPAKRGTPIRNSFLLLLFMAILALIVIVLPKEPMQMAATNMITGENGSGAAGVPEDLPLRISEIMASNKSAYPDEKGTYPDWLEIENTGDAPVNLRGIGLSDRPDRILFIFPNIDLPAGGHIVVFCDDINIAEPDQPLHARFKISSLGETITLYDGNSLPLDTVVLPPLGQDVSYARTDNGWEITERSTPGYPNTEEGYIALHTTAVREAYGLVISELCPTNRTTIADEDGEYSDWIELYNGGNLKVDLSNYALSDDQSNPVKWRFPQGASIEPGAYYLVFASGKNRSGADGTHPHTNFRLSAEGETVILSDILRQMVDRVTYDLMEDDTSFGRREGLSTSWKIFNQPTPGFPNNRSGEIETDALLRGRNTSGIFISEVITNSTGVETVYGKTSYDWIELVNRGNEAVNLRDWGLSDSISRPRKWRFPDVTIQPGEYLIVFASGLSRSPTGSSAIHTNFRLSALGETVVLATPEGEILDKLVVPRLATNNTYGRNFDQGGLFYYETPTPAAKNTEQSFAGYAPMPTIDLKGGLYYRAQTVTLSAPSGVLIRYTTDGSIPSETIGQDYTGPIEIKKASVVRARGFMPGLRPSDIATESILINAYHILPVVSLSIDPDDLWNPLTGIYAEGNDETYAKVPFKKTTYRAMKTDRSQRERLTNVEFFTSEGKQLFNQTVAGMLHGQFSLDIAQKSFRLTAKASYGSTAFDYPFFPDRPFTSYKAIILRNGGNDGSYSRLMDSMISKIVDWTDSRIIHMASAPVIVYLNGEYWGQYDIRERINAHSIAAYEGWTDPEAVDLIKGDNAVLNGSFTNYKDLLDYVKKHDLNDPEALKTVKNWVDVDNYFDFMIFEMYFGNTDAGNIKFYRQRVSSAKWKWVLFDLDWGYWFRNTNGFTVWLDPKGAGDQDFENILIRKLLEVPEMQDKFLKRYGYLYQNYLTDTDRILALLDQMAAAIEPEMGLHFNRWAGLTSKLVASDPPADPGAALNYWKNRVNRQKNIIRARPYIVWGQAQEWFELSNQQMIEYFGERPLEWKDN